MPLTSDTWLQNWRQIEIKGESAMLEVVSLKQPAISSVNFGQQNTENGITIFEEIILSILDFYNVEWKPMSIRDCAEMAFSSYYHWALAELKHFTLKFKTGDFHEIYGFSKLIPEHLMKSFAAYDQELTYARGTYNQKIKPEQRELVNPVDPERVFEALRSFKMQMMEENAANRPTKEEINAKWAEWREKEIR